MFESRIYLYAFVYNTAGHMPFVVSMNPNNYVPPCETMSVTDNLEIKDYLYNLLDNCGVIKIRNISFFLLDIEKQDKNIDIHYMCVLPIGCKLINVYNIEYYKAASSYPMLKKAIRYV